MTSRSPSSSSSTSPSPRSMGRKALARKCERGCCLVATYFPLPVVYGLTLWAVWTSAGIGFRYGFTKWSSPLASLLLIFLFILLNWCYTKAVFTPPGSPRDQSNGAGYSSLPTHESPFTNAPSLQAKSTGEVRFCKKCQARKPDRAHHCSTCKQCVLKMDHHCPWLATCVGLHNYKAFLLFLIYVSLYCWVVLGVTGLWVWKEALHDRYDESLSPINQILLCVVSGIIAIVITGFTIWHVSLAMRGMTTIECLEKTRYLKPIRRKVRNFANGHGFEGQNYGQQLVEIHANAVPGATRDEEGEVRIPGNQIPPNDQVSASDALRKNYADMERLRERDRYEDYLDQNESEKLPRAFDLGWRRNLWHLFGEQRLFWFLPVCNTTGDGWHWEVSNGWLEARERQTREREAQARAGYRYEDDEDAEAYSHRGRWPTRTAERRFVSPDGSPSSRMSMQTLRRRSSFEDNDEDESEGEGSIPASFQPVTSERHETVGKYD